MIRLGFQVEHNISRENILPARGLHRFADNIANYAVANAKAFAPARTGRLRESIHIKESINNFPIAIRIVSTDVKYAAIVEYGRTSFAPFPGRYYMKKAAEATAQYLLNYSIAQDMQAGV